MRHVLLAAIAACLASACTEGPSRTASADSAPQPREATQPTSKASDAPSAPIAAAPGAGAQGDAVALGTTGTGATDTATATDAMGTGDTVMAQGEGGTGPGMGGSGSTPGATGTGTGGAASAPGDSGTGTGGTGPTATAPGAEPTSGPCAREDVFRITTVGTGKKPAVKVEPDPGHGKAVRAAEVDLDGRGQPDLYVIFPTDAGSDGATVQALYVHCSGDRYAPVWGPEYTLELKAQDSRTQGWRDVVRQEKSGTLDAPTTKRVTMRFQNDTYQDSATQAAKP